MKIFMKGSCSFEQKEYYAFAISNSGNQIEVFLTDLYAHVESSYKFDGTDEYSFNNNLAREVWKHIKTGIAKCTNKNVVLAPVKGIGTVKRYSITKGKSNWSIDKYDGQFCGVESDGVNIEGKEISVLLEKCDSFDVQDLPYVKLTNLVTNTIKVSMQTEFDSVDSFEETIPVRSLAEISLDKDTTWLKNKKYYIVNDEVQAEYIFKYLENYKGIISYDTETTGLCINMFGEVGSKRKEFIDAENQRLISGGKAPYKVDKLVGIIFCVEKDVSYYFPCGNRKFKNIYSDINNENTRKIAENILARYTIGDLRESKTSMSNYIRTTPINEWSCDVILMERVRNILEKGWIGTHHGSFEYKVDMMYSIDTNIKDDSMLLHQLLFKFRSTKSNRGEPSNLKYLTKVEFGIDQLDLKDFFVSYSEDASGLAKQEATTKKKKAYIDFSYMDYDGAKAYAPADGDFTLGLIVKYKNELNTPELKSQEYLYNVEIIVSCAIGYMEYYGHRLDEGKIRATKVNTYSDMLLYERKIRDYINANTEEEIVAFEQIKDLQKRLSTLEKERYGSSFNDLTDDEKKLLLERYENVLNELDNKNLEVREMIDTSENLLNLASPQQVCELFYDKLKIPPVDKDKLSVSKRAIQSLSKAKDENNQLKYPVVKDYMDWKNCSTLLTKFFDNLPAYSYPGGFIFSSYGQISTATGRMSCLAQGTKITMPGELRNIEDVKIGDYVYCYDDSGKLCLSRVMDVLDNGIKECIKVTWKSTGKHDEGSIICTPDHKFRLTDGSWVEAQELVKNDRITHLRVSNEDRPRLYGSYKFCMREQDFIKKEYFNCSDFSNYVIHHKDEYTSNNKIENLQLMDKTQHYKYHAKKLVLEGRIKTEQLRCPHKILSGIEHPRYIKVSKKELESLIREAKGIVRNVNMDFNTYKQKCNELNFDYKKVASEYRTYYKEVTDLEFINAFCECDGIQYAIHKNLGIGRTKVQKTINRLGLNKVNITEFIKLYYKSNGNVSQISSILGISNNLVLNLINSLDLCINHRILKIEYIGLYHVYDLEVEGYHNFVANELVAHNCSKPNAQQYPHSVTKMVIPRDNCVFADADYSQIEYRTLTALAKEPALMEKFKDPDMDYHTTMASLMYDVPYANVTGAMRSEAKTFNFGIPYGMGLKKLAFQLKGSESPEAIADAQVKYDLYFKEQPNVRKFFDNIKEGARIYGYTKTKWGRRRYYSFTDDEGKLDTKKMGAALRQAGNASIQGTAADIFKIGVARNFLFIREHNLFGKYFITNMIHDEQLVEISCELNVQVILANLIKAMELHIDGFPPLFVGAGIGATWDEAKGKMAEIHPILGKMYVKEVEESKWGLYADNPMAPNEVYDYFNKRNYEFRENKILNYILDKSNYGQALHPVIGSLLGLQFDYGVSDELKMKFPKDKEGIDYTKQEKEQAELQSPMERLKRFIEAHNLNIDINNFASAPIENIEDSLLDEYEDELDEDLDSLDVDMSDDGDVGLSAAFKLIDESTEYFGCSLKDLIKTMGLVVSHKQRIVGINWNGITFASQQRLSKYLSNHLCDINDPGAYRVLLLNNSNQLMPREGQPQMFINHISESFLMDNTIVSE